jgi:hypothetical protein
VHGVSAGLVVCCLITSPGITRFADFSDRPPLFPLFELAPQKLVAGINQVGGYAKDQGLAKCQVGRREKRRKEKRRRKTQVGTDGCVFGGCGNFVCVFFIAFLNSPCYGAAKNAI